MKLFDTHTHYDDDKFDALSRYELIETLLRDEVDYILGAAVDVDTSRFTIETAARFPNYYAAVGIHPQSCGDYPDVGAALSEIEALAKSPKVKAIGETGFDFHWQNNPAPEVQKLFFEGQMEIARRLSLPVIVHDREAHGMTMDVVMKYPDVIGVFHSYSGSIEMAKELTRRGWYISFSGVITYKNATRLAEVVPTIPKDRILVETDCPYLAPEPKRGKTNHSGLVKYTAAKAALLRSEGYEEFVEMTTENAKRLFGIE
ncbi:MAG: TatD family hydrolase [Clostridia bacterium]|nr:TatD family hydrolase [Clostridia bacterium]